MNDIKTELKETCYDFTRNRFIPKRSKKWLEKNHFSLYEKLYEFPNNTIPHIFIYLDSGIYSEKDIPECTECDKKVHIFNGRILEQCSNRCAIKSDHVQNKTKNTCIDRYGTIRNFGEHIKKHEIGTHYLQKNFRNLDDVKDATIMAHLQKTGDWKDVADHFGLTTNSHSSSYKFMKKHGYPILAMYGSSMVENELIEYVRSLDVDIIVRCRDVICPYELDIYIPEYNIAIEFNGVYWHSTNIADEEEMFRIKHLRKTSMCESKGIRLLHIFENEWENKKEWWKSIIACRLGKNENTSFDAHDHILDRRWNSILDHETFEITDPVCYYVQGSNLYSENEIEEIDLSSYRKIWDCGSIILTK